MTGSLDQARERHTATLLLTGEVLAVGGLQGCCIPRMAELYDPESQSWRAAGDNIDFRWRHTATLLRDGRVLVAGGTCSGCGEAGHLASAELYDPTTGTWTATGSMAGHRAEHTATLLPNGMVLVAGGWGPVTDVSGYHMAKLASAELYDPATGTWTAAGSMVTARLGHSATLLLDGRVLVTGGICTGCSTSGPPTSAELYDPDTGAWTATGDMIIARQEGSGHTATLLLDGMVLVAGGAGPDGLLASAELYDPRMKSWAATGELSESRNHHTATLLRDGTVLVAGGSAEWSVERYDSISGSWAVDSRTIGAISNHTATLLPDGMVLVAGGFDSAETLLCMLYDPAG